MRARLRLLAAILAALALTLGAVACGGDDDDEGDDQPTISIPSGEVQSVPEEDVTPTPPETQPDTSGDGSGGTPPPSGGSGGGGGGGSDADDSPENDTPPPPGSPQEAFEKACEQNPEACG